MHLTRFRHACVRLEHDGNVVAIDPGVWSARRAVEDAAAVILTHEHRDHVDVDLVADLGIPVFAPAGAEIADLDTHPLEVGQSYEIAGFDIATVGGTHAPVLAHQRVRPNLGLVVNGALYHPGDALHVPPQAIDTLLVPLQASWLKTREAIRFVHDVAPRRAHGMHEGQMNERGLATVNAWLTKECGDRYSWLPAGTRIEIPSQAS